MPSSSSALSTEGLHFGGRSWKIYQKTVHDYDRELARYKIETDPPSNSILGGVAGRENVVIDCRVVYSGVRQSVVWHIANEEEPVSKAADINGVANPNFVITESRDEPPVNSKRTGGPAAATQYYGRLVIKRLTAELDRKVIYCGGVSLPNALLDAAKFYIRIYCKPCQKIKNH